MPIADVPVLLVEDDPFPRILQVILDPDTSPERCAAFAHLVAHELPDFEGWCERVRQDARGLYPAAVRHELLKFGNVMLTPHIASGPRLNGLHDFNDLIVGLSRALAS